MQLIYQIFEKDFLKNSLGFHLDEAIQIDTKNIIISGSGLGATTAFIIAENYNFLNNFVLYNLLLQPMKIDEIKNLKKVYNKNILYIY